MSLKAAPRSKRQRWAIDVRHGYCTYLCASPICALTYSLDIPSPAKGGPSYKRFELVLPSPSGVIPGTTALIKVEAPVALKGTKWEVFAVEVDPLRPDADHTKVFAKAVLQSGKYKDPPVRHEACVGFLP
jgi:hypothetical protein